MKNEKKPKETKEENKQLPVLANGRGLALRSMEDMWRFACAVRDSGLAPSSFRKPEEILIAIQSGAELGLPPMRSLNSFCVINGAARLWGDSPLALVRQSGLLEYIKERIEGDGEDMVAYCETKRKGDPESMTTTFSVDDAKTAGLWKKAGTWQQYPKRMLKYRARSFNLRDNFPDAFGGASIAEEFEGVEIPTQVPTPQVQGRDERKEAEDVKVTDTKELTKSELAKCIERTKTIAEEKVGRRLPYVEISQIFAEFAAITLNDTESDYTTAEPYNIDNLATLWAELENNGLPDEALAVVKTKEQLTKTAEETAKDKFGDENEQFKYECRSKTCGVKFDEPEHNTSGTPVCPNCNSRYIKKLEEVGAEK